MMPWPIGLARLMTIAMFSAQSAYRGETISSKKRKALTLVFVADVASSVIVPENARSFTGQSTKICVLHETTKILRSH